VNSQVIKAAGVVSGATLLSRIFGLLRDIVIAGYFGAGMASDAFFVAFRIPNLLRRLFAEGSLSIAFVPVFTEYLTKDGESIAFLFARSAIRLISILLAAAAVVGILLTPLIVRIMAPGFMASPEKLELTITLTRFMFPYIFFIGLVALCMGILNALGHFAAPALAPVMLNLAMIVSVLFLSPHLQNPVYGLAIGVLLGGLLQLLLQIPFLLRKGMVFWEAANLFHPGLKRIGKLMLPAVFGAAVYQINILVGTLLASLLPDGSVSYLYYADRLVQFPLGIFAIAAATAVLPSFSRYAAVQDNKALRETFGYAMRLVFFITIPSMVGLILLREPIVGLLFKRGAFDSQTTALTASALFYYGIGLWAFSAVRIVVTLFYALQDTRTPVKMAAISIVVNMILGVALMWPLRHGGLALATSLASMVNLYLLVRALRKKVGLIDWREILLSVRKTIFCSGVMGLAVFAATMILIPQSHASFVRLLCGVFGTILVGIGSYTGCAFLAKCPEVHDLAKMIGGPTSSHEQGSK
jgi:putative peptidoglycan lipid II flippase